jgi:hypothetical protein
MNHIRRIISYGIAENGLVIKTATRIVGKHLTLYGSYSIIFAA